jgi:23S rRNA pseudouridine1911/1915/1917 synthase
MAWSRGKEMNDAQLNVVYEDDGLLLINKPAGLVCHPTKGDIYSSLISRVRLHLGPEVKAHLVNRLDRETSGLVMVAKDDETARDMRQRWEAGAVQKGYVAVVEGFVEAREGVIDAPIGPDPLSRVAIKGCVRPDGAQSQTRFRCLQRFTEGKREYSLLEVEPKTGRKHQIRIHLAYFGHPIAGDKLYGWDENCYLAFVENRLEAAGWERLRLKNHGLHAGVLQWDQGESTGVRRFTAPLPDELRDFVEGGRPSGRFQMSAGGGVSKDGEVW